MLRRRFCDGNDRQVGVVLQRANVCANRAVQPFRRDSSAHQGEQRVLKGVFKMMAKLTTALFLAGALLAPAATHAAGTTTTQTGTTTTQKATGAVGDAAITTKVKAKFAADNQVSAMKIKVDTDSGVVKLTGNAKTQEEADKAAEIAKNTDGVTSVMNDIRIGSSTAKY
jgi:hyperosmotically inducible periplasmic protein